MVLLLVGQWRHGWQSNRQAENYANDKGREVDRYLASDLSISFQDFSSISLGFYISFLLISLFHFSIFLSLIV